VLLAVLSFGGAWLLSRLADRVAALLLARSEQRTERAGTPLYVKLKRRETTASLLRTTVRYTVFLLAVAFAATQLFGLSRAGAVAGASLLVLLVGFAAQRFLTDILTGVFMLFEGWFSVGDTIVVEPFKLEGVVEELSLRATTLRAMNGDIVRVHNSQVLAARVVPRGLRTFDVELFCSDGDGTRRLVEEVARMVPRGPLHFVRVPRVVDEEQLAEGLVRLRLRCATAAGREWLVTSFLLELIKERAGEGLLLHGPVATEVDPQATRSYARSLGAAAPVV